MGGARQSLRADRRSTKRKRIDEGGFEEEEVLEEGRKGWVREGGVGGKK